MKKLKNLIIESFDENLFSHKISKILFVSDFNNSIGDCKKIKDLFKAKFKNSDIELYLIGSIDSRVKRVFREKYDLVISVVPYNSSLKVKREIEKFSLKLKMKYFIIYENDYHTIRLATKWDLLYRLYLWKVIAATYLSFSVIIIVIPCYLFYGIHKFIFFLRQFFQADNYIKNIKS